MMKSHSEVSPTDSTEVRLITVHNVNALEFDHVWMVGMVDGILPAQHSLNKEADQRFMDEERRLCVAGMTCAKKSLSFSYARSYNGFSKQPSRFLQVMGLICVVIGSICSQRYETLFCFLYSSNVKATPSLLGSAPPSSSSLRTTIKCMPDASPRLSLTEYP